MGHPKNVGRASRASLAVELVLRRAARSASKVLVQTTCGPGGFSWKKIKVRAGLDLGERRATGAIRGVSWSFLIKDKRGSATAFCRDDFPVPSWYNVLLIRLRQASHFRSVIERSRQTYSCLK